MRPVAVLICCAFISCVGCVNNQQKTLSPNGEALIIDTLESTIQTEETQVAVEDKLPEENSSPEEKTKVIFSKETDYFYEEPEFNLHKFIADVDSSLFLNAKRLERNGIDRKTIIEPVDGELVVSTQGGRVVYEIKTFDEYGYEGNEFRYQGYNSSLGVHVVREDVAEGFGYDLIFDSNNNVLSVNGFPCFSRDGRYVLTSRIEAENVVAGFVKIYELLDDEVELRWEAWSGYSMLPIDAVWESDSTIILKMNDYPNEDSYYKRKDERVHFGRLVIDKHSGD